MNLYIRDVTISNVKARVVNIKKQDSDTARLEYNKFLWRDFNMDTYFNKKILLVDDEKDIVDLIEEVLTNDGFKNIIKAYNGLDAISLCKIACPDVVILDIMLPDIDGIEVCKKIREFSYCSILFLSSKNDDIDKILGLSSGGDDYITKPFSPREIVFRVKAQLRRQQYQSIIPSDSEVIKVGDITIDIEGNRVYKDRNEIELTGREYYLLSYMAQNVNKIIGKERLYEQVWGVYSSICDNTIMVHIRHIREKIEDNPSNPKILITVKGLGYKLVNRID
nr:response regulator transcription factor [Clostridioides difficile]